MGKYDQYKESAFTHEVMQPMIIETDMTDIVERLRLFVPHCEDPNDYLEDELLFLKAADEIERLRAELHEAHEYAGQLAVSLRRKHFSELPPFELLPDLYGRLTQIDNMTCGMARAALGEEE